MWSRRTLKMSAQGLALYLRRFAHGNGPNVGHACALKTAYLTPSTSPNSASVLATALNMIQCELTTSWHTATREGFRNDDGSDHSPFRVLVTTLGVRSHFMQPDFNNMDKHDWCRDYWFQDDEHATAKCCRSGEQMSQTTQKNEPRRSRESRSDIAENLSAHYFRTGDKDGSDGSIAKASPAFASAPVAGGE